MMFEDTMKSAIRLEKSFRKNSIYYISLWARYHSFIYFLSRWNRKEENSSKMCKMWSLLNNHNSMRGIILCLTHRKVLLQPGEEIAEEVSIMATSPGTKLLMATFSHSNTSRIVSRIFHKVSVTD